MSGSTVVISYDSAILHDTFLALQSHMKHLPLIFLNILS